MRTKKSLNIGTIATLPVVRSKMILEINHELAGGRIRVMREKCGMSLRTLATQMRISAPFLSDLERGRRNWTEALFVRAVKKITRKAASK